VIALLHCCLFNYIIEIIVFLLLYCNANAFVVCIIEITYLHTYLLPYLDVVEQDRALVARVKNLKMKYLGQIINARRHS